MVVRADLVEKGRRKEALARGRSSLGRRGGRHEGFLWGRTGPCEGLGRWWLMGYKHLLIHPVCRAVRFLSAYCVFGASGLVCRELGGAGAQMVNRGTTRILHPDRSWEGMKSYPEDGE